MSLLRRLGFLAEVRDMLKSVYAPIGSVGVSSILTMTFDESLLGENWTVTDGDTETYTGTVDSLTQDVHLLKLETTYTASVTNGQGGTIEVGLFYEGFELQMTKED